jgi:hypothetical protein
MKQPPPIRPPWWNLLAWFAYLWTVDPALW